jgi:hypothetical protein
VAGREPASERGNGVTVKLLTISDVVSLATIVSAAIHTQRCARAMDNGDVVYGTARSIGDENGNFAGPNDDIRDCYLRVTLESGWEAFWTVASLMDEVGSGMFVTPYDEYEEG